MVMVTAAFAGGVTVFGLTAQMGGDVVVCVDKTWQVRSTVPLKPLTVPTVMLEEDVPPGATAPGENGAACRVKSAWAEAEESNVRHAAVTHKITSRAWRQRILRFGLDKLDFDKMGLENLDFEIQDFDESDFHMSRFK